MSRTVYRRRVARMVIKYCSAVGKTEVGLLCYFTGHINIAVS